MLPEFRDSTVYLDIETTGLKMWGFEITTISLYDGNSIFWYVKDQNLNDFIHDIQKYKVIVTYNGKSFDIPFIESHFGTNLTQAHIDLRYILASLGYRGGLKGCEKQLGIDRGDLNNVDGYFAVLLWYDFLQNRNQKALETLLAYNIEDTVNLETLMVLAYNMKLKGTPFFQTHQLPEPTHPNIPFEADRQTIDRIKRQIFREPSLYWGWYTSEYIITIGNNHNRLQKLWGQPQFPSVKSEHAAPLVYHLLYFVNCWDLIPVVSPLAYNDALLDTEVLIVNVASDNMAKIARHASDTLYYHVEGIANRARGAAGIP